MKKLHITLDTLSQLKERGAIALPILEPSELATLNTCAQSLSY
jgi:hypothetical protein